MLHNKARIESYEYALKGMGLSESSIDFCASWGKNYAEHQAAPLEARILALEEALGIAHEAAIKADRKERGRIGNVSGNELYAMFSNAPVEPHPLLADREVVL